jgi:hypothetical protein
MAMRDLIVRTGDGRPRPAGVIAMFGDAGHPDRASSLLPMLQVHR